MAPVLLCAGNERLGPTHVLHVLQDVGVGPVKPAERAPAATLLSSDARPSCRGVFRSAGSDRRNRAGFTRPTRLQDVGVGRVKPAERAPAATLLSSDARPRRTNPAAGRYFIRRDRIRCDRTGFTRPTNLPAVANGRLSSTAMTKTGANGSRFAFCRQRKTRRSGLI